jgi:MoaA/NifB/PqqE/SkfB family radical SAM enzyme
MNYVMRGYDGYLDLIIGLMDELKERKIPMSLKTVATRKNINDIPNIAKLIRKYPLDVWLISEFTPVGEAKKNKEEFELDENELSKLQLSNLPFKVAIRSSNQDYSIPFLFLGPGRNVWTTSKRKRDYRFIGNFFEEEIFGLWRKICQTNPVNKNYLENTWTEKK